MAEAEMVKLEVTWERVVELWWGWVWRFVVFALVPGMVIGYVVAFMTSVIMGPMLGRPLGVLVLCAVAAILSIPVCKMVLLTDFGSFCIALVAKPPDSKAR